MAMLDTQAAATFTGLAPATLSTMRVRGGGPRFIKLGHRVVYDPADLGLWLDAQRKRSTSDYPTRVRQGAA